MSHPFEILDPHLIYTMLCQLRTHCPASPLHLVVHVVHIPCESMKNTPFRSTIEIDDFRNTFSNQRLPNFKPETLYVKCQKCQTLQTLRQMRKYENVMSDTAQLLISVGGHIRRAIAIHVSRIS